MRKLVVIVLALGALTFYGKAAHRLVGGHSCPHAPSADAPTE
jgi:hypothetical protein